MTNVSDLISTGVGNRLVDQKLLVELNADITRHPFKITLHVGNRTLYVQLDSFISIKIERNAMQT